MESTEVLIQAAQRGEATAFDGLVEKFGGPLFGYFYRSTGSRDDAEDLLQETFLRVVRAIGDYQHRGRFEPWLFQIARNLLRDRGRRNRPEDSARTGAGDEDDGQTVAHLDSPEPRPDHRLEREDEIDRMQQAVEQLPAEQRQVILLRHFAQLSFREIAEELEIPLGTALARAHRGLERLRELMSSEG